MDNARNNHRECGNPDMKRQTVSFLFVDVSLYALDVYFAFRISTEVRYLVKDWGGGGGFLKKGK